MPGIMEHIFNPAIQPAEGKRILHSRAAWATGWQTNKNVNRGNEEKEGRKREGPSNRNVKHNKK